MWGLCLPPYNRDTITVMDKTGDGEESGGEQETRRSGRPNIGVPPERYGDWVFGENPTRFLFTPKTDEKQSQGDIVKDDQVAGFSGSKSTPRRTSVSGSSVSSSKSRRLRAELEAKKKLDLLNEERRKENEERRKEKEDQVRLEHQLTLSEIDEEQEQDLGSDEEILSKTFDISQLENVLNWNTACEQNVETEKVNAVSVPQCSMLFIDPTSALESSFEELRWSWYQRENTLKNKEELQKTLVQEKLAELEKYKQVIKSQEEAAKVHLEKLRQEAENISKGIPNQTTLSSPQPQPMNIDTSGDKSSDPMLEQLVKIFGQAFGKVNSDSSTSSTNKFLARQVHGKDLPIFTGKPEEWITFITSFRITTKECEYDDSANLPRLHKCLKGEALRHVQPLMGNPENLKRILEKLEARFGDPDLIVSTLTQKVKAATAVNENKPETLIEFGNAVDSLTTTLEALKNFDYLKNPAMLKELLDKLPVSYKMDWYKWLDEDKTHLKDLKGFSTWLDKKVRYAYKFCPPKEKSDGKDSKVKNVPDRKHENVFVAAASPPKDKAKQREIKCSFCSATGHRIFACKDFAKETLEKRRKFVADRKLCFSCLIFGHNLRDCRNKKTCGKEGCEKTHHPLLHITEPPKVEVEKVVPETVGHVGQTKVKPQGEVLYQIIPITMKGPKGEMSTYAMLDSGSAYTMLDASTAEKLGIHGEHVPFTFNGLDSSIHVPESRMVELHIKSKSNNAEFLLKSVRTIEDIKLPCRSLKKTSIRKWKHLEGIKLSTFEGARPKLLIGLPHATLLVPMRRVDGPMNAPIAAETKLGWVLFGSLPPTIHEERTESVLFIHRDDPENDALHQLVKDTFSTESFGVRVMNEKPRSKEDKQALTMMEALTHRIDVGWETGLLWKDEVVHFPESKSNATKRLMFQEKKMDRDSNFAQQYCAKIEDYLQKGYLRKLSSEEAAQENPKTWYLPHFGVINPNKPKLRLVFDAAAKSKGVSLNTELLTGPDFLTPLPSVLCEFRQRKIAISADIKEMYHQVKIREEDRTSQRMLWRGMDRDNPPGVLEMTVMMFGTACSPSCAQYVKNRNAEEFLDKFPEAVDAIINKHYVDDYLDSLDTVEEALARCHEVFYIHQQGGFHICNFIGNSEDFLSRLPVDLRAKGIKNFEKSDNNLERVLGLYWDAELDIFTFKLNFYRVKNDILSGKIIPTKREALSLLMSIFDPLGFLALFTVKAKIILQETWKTGIGWDDELPKSLVGKWISWIEELKEIKTFKIPRCYSPLFSSSQSVQLHIFVDASEMAFSAVAYFRIHTGYGIHSAFVMAKTRVRPLKILSIPRMELQAAVMGSRLGSCIHEEHDVKIHKTFYWSDSKTVLCWIRSDGAKHQQFVSHRIGEIHELTNVCDWKWLPSIENVADEATRDGKKSNWSESGRWINGPNFLKLPEEEWPQEDVKGEHVPIEQLEFKKEFVGVVFTANPIINPSRKVWLTLLRVVAWIKRFIFNCRKPSVKRKGELLPEEITLAELYWIKKSQSQSFVVELSALTRKVPMDKTSKLYTLSPMLDENGIIRIDGRIKAAKGVGDELKFPAILDPANEITRKLIEHYHNKANHHGQERVVNELRQRYHIISIRAAVRRSWTKCQKCKNARAIPKVPLMGQIPLCRLNSCVPPFTSTGMDYFGPIEVKVARHHEKRYGALFTCLTTRAVHVEIAHSLTTDSCIMAIRRFVSRRGCPSTIHSDNGTNLRGADTELKKALLELDQQKIKSTMTTQGIKWLFIPPISPHMGGSWESLVKAIKVAFKSTLTNIYPTDETLLTLMAEAEHVVNSRPLTHVSCDPTDPEALTPNHFLIGKSSNMQAPGIFDDTDLCLRKQWRIAQRLTDIFWKKWITEYLPNLTKRSKWHEKQDPIKVDDIVVIVDKDMPRNTWPLGRIVAVFPGGDGQVRVADVQTQTGVYRRPVAKLAKLDVYGDSMEVKHTLGNQELGEDPAVSPPEGSMAERF